MRIALLLHAGFLLLLLGCSGLQNYSSSLISAHEAAAVQHLRNISDAEAMYFNTHGRKSFGTLQQLAGVQLISPALAGGEADGYRFAVRVITRPESGQPSYEAVATPARYGATGNRAFYLDAGGKIRAADREGAEATANDPALEN